jgi:DNA-binding GntR family transcriptional regulator
VISARAVAADEEVTEALAVEPETSVVEMRRVRTAGRRPAIYSIEYLPADIIHLSRDRKALGGSMYRLLTQVGHPVDHGEATIAPSAADARLAQLLQVPEGSLLQHLRQIDYDDADRPVMFSLEWHVPSVIELSVYRRGPGPLSD